MSAMVKFFISFQLVTLELGLQRHHRNDCKSDGTGSHGCEDEQNPCQRLAFGRA